MATFLVSHDICAIEGALSVVLPSKLPFHGTETPPPGVIPGSSTVIESSFVPCGDPLWLTRKLHPSKHRLLPLILHLVLCVLAYKNSPIVLSTSHITRHQYSPDAWAHLPVQLALGDESGKRRMKAS